MGVWEYEWVCGSTSGCVDVRSGCACGMANSAYSHRHITNLIPTLHSTTNASLLSIVIAACGRSTGDRLQLWCYVRTYIHTYISVTRAREERGQWLPHA